MIVPYRRISRYGNELGLSGILNLGCLLPRQFDRSVVLMLLLRQCLAEWTAYDRIAPPASPVEYFSINGLAASLGRSFETTRRHVKALIVDGLCVAAQDGIAISNDPATAARIVDYLVRTHDTLVRLIEDIAPTGVLPPPRAASGARPSLAAMLRTALDIHLMPFESFRGKIGSWTSMALLHGIAVANVRHITQDRALSERFAFESTPEDRRSPASIAAVADLLAIPRATAWRHRALLEDANMLSPKDDGWVLQTVQVRRDEIEQSVVASVDYYLRRIGQLIGLGLDPQNVASYYLGAREPYAPV